MAELTHNQYYRNSEQSPEDLNWGSYQYVLLQDLINDFLLVYVGDDKVINKVDRNEVVFHAKRAIQELNYDALREVKGFEFEVPNTLKMALPHDYVTLVKVAYVGANGLSFPIMPNRHLSTPTAYLQDNTAAKNILFDNNGDALTGTPVSETSFKTKAENHPAPSTLDTGGRYGIDGSTANSNGTYVIDKNQGFIMFSSDLMKKDVVIEYLSDGMYDLADNEIKIHKLAENYIYDYLQSCILKSKVNVQEYIVRRAQKQASASLRNAKIRLNSIKLHELTQVLRGATKWVK